MEMIKKYAGILMMLTLLVGFTSCEDDEDIYDDLMDVLGLVIYGLVLTIIR